MEIEFLTSFAASLGDIPLRIASTANNDGNNLIMTSPSPVAAAAPTSESAYAPAPGIGESPTLLLRGAKE